MWFYAMIATLIAVLVWLTRVREQFTDASVSVKDAPDPKRLFAMARELLKRYEDPEIWNHATAVHDKDPGQLARMALGIQNGAPK
jgi:hypothetical protein